MPEPKRNRLAATVFWNPDLFVAPRKKPKRRHARRPKRYHRIFRVPIALGLFPTKSRQCDPFGLRLSTMHIMEGDCEKPAGGTDSDSELMGATKNGLVVEENGRSESPPTVGSPEVAADQPSSEATPPSTITHPTENGVLQEEEHAPPQSTPPPPDHSLTDEKRSPEAKHEKEDACSEEEEKSLHTEVQPKIEETPLKRTLDGDGSNGCEGDMLNKRLRPEEIKEEPGIHPASVPMLCETINTPREEEREGSIQSFIEGCTRSIEEINATSERLLKEMGALSELAKAKEIEWNSILRLKKLKEEIYERLQRKKREIMVVEEKYDDAPTNTSQFNQIPCGPSGGHIGGMPRIPEIAKQQRPILPKPFNHSLEQHPCIKEGRNGPIIDVKSIIADYSGGRRCRLQNEGIPSRRGRRVRADQPRSVSASPSLISMANMALGSGSSMRAIHDPPPYPNPAIGQEGQYMERGGMSFKDALVQFAKLGGGGGGAGRGGSPYPEVTLHPVGAPPPASSSLLHGILTKAPAPPTAPAAPPAHTKPTSFSPTLARLLTAPDSRPQPAHQNSHYPRPPPVTISEILASKKSRTDITITPVSGAPPVKPKEEVVLLDDDEEGSGGDRLVIDEGPEGGCEDVPQCQGCRSKSAQFVCAGCGNQWYCSRECQVTAWEEHSDICSG